MQQFDPGEVARLRARYSDASDAPFDPPSPSFVVISPTGVETTLTGMTTPAVIRESVGSFYVDWPLTALGVWEYQAIGGTETETSYVLCGDTHYDGPLEPWTTWEEILDVPALSLVGADTSTVTLRQQSLIIDGVSELLWNLSGRAYPGIGKTTRSLCVSCSGCGSWRWAGGWDPFPYGRTGSGCSCPPTARLTLRGRFPILGIRSVYIDDIKLDSAVYRLENWADLVRVDGNQWPVGSDLTSPTAFQATWFYGRQVPSGGRRAATLLGAEYALAALAQPCLLPQYRLSTANVEGATYVLVDQNKEKGRTGFQPADDWLNSIEVGRQPPGGVFDPDDDGDIIARAIVG